MIILRGLAGVILLLAALGCVVCRSGWWLGLLMAAGFIFYRLTCHSWRQALRSCLPVLMTATAFWVMQQFASSPASLLPLKMVAVFLFTSAAFRIFPWMEILLRTPRETLRFQVALYLFFIRHFVVILGDESLRLLRAWRWTHRGLHGRVLIRSLAGAMTGLFSRCFIRAEHFFAAQLLKGLAE
jgi:hypothetical protein